MTLTSQTPASPLRTPIPSTEAFLQSLSHDQPVGPSLRYESLYDDVRLARQEEDPRLSMGVWQRELKQADWYKVEAICVEALLKTSKDLQIAAWLAEAWTSLDGIKGYTRGIDLINGLSKTFWPTIHPQLPEDGDAENRSLIFEWMDMALSMRLLTIPLTQSKIDHTALGLGYLKSAQHAEAAQKRVEKSTQKPSSSKVHPSKLPGTSVEFYKYLDQTPDSYLLYQQEDLRLAQTATNNLKSALDPLLQKAAPSFSQILGILKDMERLLETTLIKRTPQTATPNPTNSEVGPQIAEDPVPAAAVDPTSLRSRDEAYRQLEAIAAFLEQNDPHSLAPQLLRQLIRWKNKKIMDIFSEIAQSPEEFEILKKVLGVSPS